MIYKVEDQEGGKWIYIDKHHDERPEGVITYVDTWAKGHVVPPHVAIKKEISEQLKKSNLKITKLEAVSEQLFKEPKNNATKAAFVAYWIYYQTASHSCEEASVFTKLACKFLGSPHGNTDLAQEATERYPTKGEWDAYQKLS